MTEAMVIDDPSTSPQDNKFVSLRKELILNNTVETSVRILNVLVSLNPEDVDDIEWIDCKDVLSMVLEKITCKTLLENHQILLLHGIEKSFGRVLEVLADFFHGKPDAIGLLKTTSLAVAVAFARRIEDEVAYETIAKLLAPLTSRKEVVEEFEHQLKSGIDSERRFRIYQVLLSTLRAECYTDGLDNIFNSLVDELSKDDFLIQLTTLDLLTDAAIANKSSASLLVQKQVTTKIYSYLEHSKDSPDGGFLYASCIKFFGSLCRCYPEALQEFPVFLPMLLNMVRNYNCLDAPQRLLSVETFAHVAYTEQAKKFILESEDTETLKHVFQTIGFAVNNGPTELRARVLGCIATMFVEGEVSTLSRWFSFLSFLPELLTICLNRPFVDLREAALNVLSHITAYQFGVAAMFSDYKNVEDFKTWLLDPASESEWRLNCVKSDIIRSINKNNWTCLDDHLKHKLKAYFIRATPEPSVATMEI